MSEPSIAFETAKACDAAAMASLRVEAVKAGLEAV
jgi:hypothetical protein